MSDATRASVPIGIALYMAVVQFLFVTTWTIYVIFLPGLLKTAGLSATLVPMLLIIDQLIFMVTDIYVRGGLFVWRFASGRWQTVRV